MHVERFGHGPRHFLGLHGWNGTAAAFRPLVPMLPDDVTLWAADLPGCGRSERPRDMSMDAVMEEVERLALRLPAPLNVIGICSGAIPGLLLAQRQPTVIAHLAMIDAFAFVPWYFRVFTMPAGKLAYFTAFANPVGRLIANLSLRAKRAENTDLTAGFRDTDHEMNLAYLRMFEQAGDSMQWSLIETPVDLLYGERTFAAVRQSIPLFQRRLNVRRVDCLRGAGHLPLLEATEQIGSLLFASQHSGENLWPTPHPSTNIAN